MVKGMFSQKRNQRGFIFLSVLDKSQKWMGYRRVVRRMSIRYNMEWSDP